MAGRWASGITVDLLHAGLNSELYRTLEPKRFRPDEYGV